jgi:hypothetical protein
MHIILVRVVHSIQNSCIKYSTQNQHFAEMFTYSDNTNFNETAGICTIVAVVDTHSLVGARNHCEGSVYGVMHLLMDFTQVIGQHAPGFTEGATLFFQPGRDLWSRTGSIMNITMTTGTYSKKEWITRIILGIIQHNNTHQALFT